MKIWAYLEEVTEGTFLMEVSDEPKFSLQAVTSSLSTHEMKNIVVIKLW